jgi:hypothetical protein
MGATRYDYKGVVKRLATALAQKGVQVHVEDLFASFDRPEPEPVDVFVTVTAPRRGEDEPVDWTERYRTTLGRFLGDTDLVDGSDPFGE